MTRVSGALRRHCRRQKVEPLNVDPVIIIGAGPAGLAVAAELRSLGVPSQILERSDSVAHSWRSRYDCLQLNTSRWMSRLRLGDDLGAGGGATMFLSRDQVVRYLELFAERHEVNIRFGVQVNRIAPIGNSWLISTNAELLTARQVVVAIGSQHTPRLPDWPEREQFGGRILHSIHYHNAKPFRDRDVLVVGAGCSGLDIARDLAHGGARSVRLAVSTQPQLLLKSSLGLPTDVLAAVLLRMPVRTADRIMRLVQRQTVGDLTRWGLTAPAEGVVSGLHAGKVPTVVSPGVIAAVKAEDFALVSGVATVNAKGVHLLDGTTLHPDAVIAATGFSTGLDSLAGALGVLDSRGCPLHHGGAPVRPGLRFIGYFPCMGVIRRDARRVCGHLYSDLTRALPDEPADPPT